MTSFYVSKESTHVSGCCKLVLSSNLPDSPLPMVKTGRLASRSDLHFEGAVCGLEVGT